MSKIPTKEEYEKLLNNALGTDIEWSRMLKEDLIAFKNTLLDPEKLKEIYIAVADKPNGKMPNKEVIKFGKKFLKNWQGPIVKKARTVYDKLKKMEEMEE